MKPPTTSSDAPCAAGQRDLRDLSYDELARIVTGWVARVEIGRNPSSPAHVELADLARFLSRRHFGTFRRRVPRRGPLTPALLELFLLARIRLHVLAYLSVQEAADFEGVSVYDTRAPELIAQSLRHIGRSSSCVLTFRVMTARFSLDIDPLIPLRRMYALHLFAARQGRRVRYRTRLAAAYHRTMFQVKAAVTARVLRSALRRATHAPVGGLVWFFARPDMQRAIAVSIHVLFPAATGLQEDQWRNLLDRVAGYFVPRLTALMAAIPTRSVADHGLIKLVKVAFGTLVGRTAVRDAHEPDPVDFIVNTLRLAYSWGVTYPLVDNVLDSADTPALVRTQLIDVLRGLFADVEREPTAGLHPSVREVRDRLAEVLSLVPPHRLPAARRALGHLLESHHRDAGRRLAAATDEAVYSSEVMADTAMKAALVRLATMEVCGIPVDAETVGRNLARSLFNQLGDDLWDIYEDYDDGRVTPFTLFLVRGGGSNPFDFYYDYAVSVTRGLSRRRRVAALMGYCETLRDTLMALRRRGADPLRVAPAVDAALGRAGGAAMRGLVEDIPHVDFDAVMFAFEAACFDLAR